MDLKEIKEICKEEIVDLVNESDNYMIWRKYDTFPTDTKELRKLEEMSMSDIREINLKYWKWLSDKAYEKHRDGDGFYFSAKSGYKSKNKLDFQIDHIIPLSNGGLSTIDNLQILTRQENAEKSNR